MRTGAFRSGGARLRPAFPTDALEHGWYPAFDPQGIVFARQAIHPAVIPVLSSLRLRVWRRGDGYHSLVGTSSGVHDAPAWDEVLRRFEEDCNAPMSPRPPGAHHDF